MYSHKQICILFIIKKYFKLYAIFLKKYFSHIFTVNDWLDDLKVFAYKFYRKLQLLFTY